MPTIAQQDYIRLNVNFSTISGSVPDDLNNTLCRAIHNGTIFDVILMGSIPNSERPAEARILGWESYQTDKYVLYLIIPGFGGTVSGITITEPADGGDDPEPGPKDDGGGTE